MNEEKRKPPKYARCKLANIAVPNETKEFVAMEDYIELVDTLPNDCIRIKLCGGWCGVICHKCGM